MASVLDLYDQLNAEQRNFIQKRRLAAGRTPEGWLVFFKDLAAFDARADRMRRLAYDASFSLLLVLIIVNLVRFGGDDGNMDSFSLFLPAFLGFIPLFLGIALRVYWLIYAIGAMINFVHLYVYLADAPGFSALDLVISIVVLLVTLAAFIVARKLSQVDIANELRELIYPFLQLLREDMDKDEEVALQVDTSGEWREQGGALIVDKPWCAGAAQLADGTHLSWAFSEETSLSPASAGPRRPARKFSSKIEISLRVRSKVYQVSEFDELRAVVWADKKKIEVSGPDIEGDIAAIRQRVVRSKLTVQSQKQTRRSTLVEKIRVRCRPGERRHLVKVRRTIKGRIGHRPDIQLQKLAELLGAAYGRVERSGVGG